MNQIYNIEKTIEYAWDTFVITVTEILLPDSFHLGINTIGDPAHVDLGQHCFSDTCNIFLHPVGLANTTDVSVLSTNCNSVVYIDCIKILLLEKCEICINIQCLIRKSSNLSSNLLLSRIATVLPDGSYCGSTSVIEVPGYYSVYNSPDSPDKTIRWIIKEEFGMNGSECVHFQTAYAYQGPSYTIKQRSWTLVGGTGHCGEWI